MEIRYKELYVDWNGDFVCTRILSTAMNVAKEWTPSARHCDRSKTKVGKEFGLKDIRNLTITLQLRRYLWLGGIRLYGELLYTDFLLILLLLPQVFPSFLSTNKFLGT